MAVQAGSTLRAPGGQVIKTSHTDRAVFHLSAGLLTMFNVKPDEEFSLVKMAKIWLQKTVMLPTQVRLQHPFVTEQLYWTPLVPNKTA